MNHLVEDRLAGHTVFAGPAWNAVGEAYVIIIAVYTTLLTLCSYLYWRHLARTNAVRIRGLIITILAVWIIHGYLLALFIVYPLNGDFLCGTEFWSMNVMFPLGIAIYQASNVRLLAYYQRQDSMLELRCFSEKQEQLRLWPPRPTKLWQWLKLKMTSGDLVWKTYKWIGLGFIVQIVVAFFLYYGSRRIRPDTGFFGHPTDPLNCRRGFEWIPSVLWQFLWAWCFGPWVLFRTRKIKDTHYWRIQTQLAVVAGMPGTPLWLGFLYGSNSTMAAINQWFPPAMWFAPCLIVMQVSSLAFPCLDHWSERRRKAKSIASSSSSITSTRSNSVSVASRKSQELAGSLEAFDYHLRYSLVQLLDFATHRDFTSENILFLREVRDFKCKWRRVITMAGTYGDLVGDSHLIDIYDDAARIYFELVNPHTAKLPINIDSRIQEDLKSMFRTLRYEPPVVPRSKEAAVMGANSLSRLRSLSKKRSKKDAFRKAVAPWESPTTPTAAPSTPATLRPDTSSSETGLIDIGLSAAQRLNDPSGSQLVLPGPLVAIPEATAARPQGEPVISSLSDPRPASPVLRGTIIKLNAVGLRMARTTAADYVPHRFDFSIFDQAERSVRRDVYHNTWKSYIKNLSAEQLEEITNNRLSSRIPRRAGQGGMSRMTDVEMYDLDLELQDRLHHGVLDTHLGPIPIETVNTRCAACRLKQSRKMQEVVYSMGIDAPIMTAGYGIATSARPVGTTLDGVDEESEEEDEDCCSVHQVPEVATKVTVITTTCDSSEKKHYSLA